MLSVFMPLCVVNITKILNMYDILAINIDIYGIRYKIYQEFIVQIGAMYESYQSVQQEEQNCIQ